MSHPIRIDATDLTFGSFVIPGVNDSQAIDGGTVQTLDLEPGSYSIFIGSGLLIAVFAMSESGVIDYGTSYDTTVSGRGTDTLKIIGFEITVDASALDSPGFIFATIGNIGEQKEFVTHANVRLAATRYLVQQQSGRIADFEFTVNPDGLIEYDPRFDSNHEGFLAGRGTNKLTIVGYSVRIDARTLSYPRFLVPGMTKSFLPGNVIHKLQLIPDTYSFQFPGGGYANFVFRVTQAGEIDFDPAYDGFLAGRGTRTLEMRGYQTSIDARRFPRGIYLFGLDAWVTSTDLRLLPDSYAFMEGAGGICDIRFRLDVSGRLSYDAALDVRAGGCLAGQGTHQLAFLGFPLGLDTASLGTGVHIGGMHVAFNKAQPFQTVYLFPKQDIELTTLTNPPIKAKLSVSEKGAITINVPPPLAILQLRGISVLQLGRTNDTETTHQETSTGDNIMAEQSEPLIKLEPGGTAPILSYNVPEPTSYSGRNFIDLQ